MSQPRIESSLEPPPAYTHPFGETIGLLFDRYEPGVSGCVLEVAQSLLNPNGVLHGGVMFAMADTGMGGALYSVLDLEAGERCAATQLAIAYHAPVRQGSVRCDSQVIHRSRRVATLTSRIFNDGRLVATAMGTFSVFSSRPAEEKASA